MIKLQVPVDWKGKTYHVDLRRGHCIAIPLDHTHPQPNAFFAPLYEAAPHKAGDWIGDTREVLNSRGVGQIITQDTPNKQLKALLEPFNPVYQPEVQFTESDISEKRLKRFSRYWEKVGVELFGTDFEVKNRV